MTTSNVTTTSDSIAIDPGTTVVGRKRELAFKVALEGPGGTVIMQASPLLSEARSAFYDGYAITHLPSELFSYKFTSSRKFQVQARLVSRNVPEAEENAKYLDLIRKWIQPDFGNSGATPPILKLYGYNNNNLDGVQCIIKSYSWGFPDDVDYIHQAFIPMPVIGQLTIELDEVYSAEQLTAGNWKINVSEGGMFEGGETEQEDSLLPTDTGIANSKSPFNTDATFTNPSNKSSSKSLLDDVSRVTQIASNSLVKGTSPSQLISQAAGAVVGTATTAVSDAFGRSNNRPPPNIITG